MTESDLLTLKKIEINRLAKCVVSRHSLSKLIKKDSALSEVFDEDKEIVYKKLSNAIIEVDQRRVNILFDFFQNNLTENNIACLYNVSDARAKELIDSGIEHVAKEAGYSFSLIKKLLETGLLLSRQISPDKKNN